MIPSADSEDSGGGVQGDDHVWHRDRRHGGLLLQLKRRPVMPSDVEVGPAGSGDYGSSGDNGAVAAAAADLSLHRAAVEQFYAQRSRTSVLVNLVSIMVSLSLQLVT